MALHKPHKMQVTQHKGRIIGTGHEDVWNISVLLPVAAHKLHGDQPKDLRSGKAAQIRDHKQFRQRKIFQVFQPDAQPGNFFTKIPGHCRSGYKLENIQESLDLS